MSVGATKENQKGDHFEVHLQIWNYIFSSKNVPEELEYYNEKKRGVVFFFFKGEITGTNMSA